MKNTALSVMLKLERGDIVRGYGYEKGKFVIIKDEELEDLPLKNMKNIEILKFVNPEDIDPYLEKSYYLQPAEGAEGAYVLLRTVMKRKGKVGIGRFVLKERELTGVWRIFNDTL